MNEKIPITTHNREESSAAVKIQSAFRSHRVRNLTIKIKTINCEADTLQDTIQLQETVDALRTNNQERLKINEALMKLLFALDSVPGIDPTVREFRRNVSRRIVGLQEILDSICDAKCDDDDGFLRDCWEDMILGIEKQVCLEKGGEQDYLEFERFCVENLGFQCLQRFLRQ
uniref:BAG family molecular chaperone regulator 5, mitochondrial-like n=1 Tax=Erigeron canadensis TaxID=72917 RepID=UPI001CB909CE|nr:BAG family molecular chaperone regulator 5, mitochondrial-like [Erigeron canadensis]